MKENRILELSKAFGLRIIRMAEFLYSRYPGNRIVDVLTKQVLRSATSIAANVSESTDAQSTNDFISKLSIALKEADETKTWLEFLYESDYLEKECFDSIYDDNENIRATLINIIRKLKYKKE